MLITMLTVKMAISTESQGIRKHHVRDVLAGEISILIVLKFLIKLKLNDVWAAPTWSSIDFNLRWKIAHHFIRRSFAPLIVSPVCNKHIFCHNLSVYLSGHWPIRSLKFK